MLLESAAAVSVGVCLYSVLSTSTCVFLLLLLIFLLSSPNVILDDRPNEVFLFPRAQLLHVVYCRIAVRTVRSTGRRMSVIRANDERTLCTYVHRHTHNR